MASMKEGGEFMECCCGVIELQMLRLMLRILKPYPNQVSKCSNLLRTEDNPPTKCAKKLNKLKKLSINGKKCTLVSTPLNSTTVGLIH